MKQIAILWLSLVIMAGCEQKPASGKEQVYIVATTGMVGDAVQAIVGDNAKVEALMGPGVDPHLYKATQGDLQALRKADIIVYNGLHLEGKMQEIFIELAKTKKVICMADGLTPAELIETGTANSYAQYDPHIWFDVQLWSKAVAFLCDELASALGESTYRETGQQYADTLQLLHEEVERALLVIPDDQRVLITSHDAFEYFGRAYRFEVLGLQGISTAAEFGLKDITDMVNLVIERNIKAVFVESSVSQKSIEAVVEGCQTKGHALQLGGTLFSDAMGAEDTPEGRYPGMVRHNVRTIVQAINGKQP